MMSREWFKGIARVFPIILAGVCLALVFVISLLCSPIADDWSFYIVSRRVSFFEAMASCMNHTGRLGQWTIIYVGMYFFGMNAVRVLPIVMFLAMSILASILLRQFNLIRKNSKALIYGILLSGCFFFLLPSTFDSFLWYDSSASYIMSIVFLLLWVAIAKRLYDKNMPKIWQFAILSIVAFVAQLFSEPTCLISIGFTILAFGYYLIKHRKFDDRAKIMLTALISLVAGFALLFFSPGSTQRRIDGGHDFSIIYTFVSSLTGFKMIWQGFTLGNIGLLVVTSLFLASELKADVFNKRNFTLMCLVFVAFTYCVFCVNNFSQGYMPYRVLTVPTLGVVLFASYLICFIYRILKLKRVKYFTLALTIIGVLVLCLLIKDNSFLISELSVRQALVKYRDEVVKAQIENNSDTIEIPEIPLRVTGDAEDLFYYEADDGEKHMIWVAENYINYIGADRDKCVLIVLPEYHK